MTKVFLVDDYPELLALQRVFREAKFCSQPDDVEVSHSPIVARMFERLIAILIANDVERDGESARLRWIQWLTIDESRDEWFAAVRRAGDDPRWESLSHAEQLDHARLLLSPFVVQPEIADRFVLAVNQANRQHNK